MIRWLFLLFALVTCQIHAVQVVDDRGVTVQLQRPPQRIVTLLPSLTETVCELGSCDRLVGVDNYSNWPASVKKLPHVGGLEDANVEIIVGLKPDLVMMGVSSRALARLQALGIPVAGFEVKTMEDVQRVLDKVGRLLEVDGADTVWRRMNDGIASAGRSIPAGRRGASVYFEVGSDGYAASASSHIGEILTRLGAVNVVPGHLGTVPKLNPEFVVRADPQLIMISDRTAAGMAQRPGWNRIRAVREGRVCPFTSTQNDVIMRPGPRLAEAAEILARCLRGEM